MSRRPVEGDAVLVTFPSGREIPGRLLCWIEGRGRADVITSMRGDVHNYPRSWIRPASDEEGRR